MTPSEREHALRIWQQAQRAGHDPWERLDHHSLVLTSARYHQIRAEAFYELARQLENIKILPILEFYGSSGTTAHDAQRSLVQWIRTHARKEEPGT